MSTASRLTDFAWMTKHAFVGRLFRSNADANPFHNFASAYDDGALDAGFAEPRYFPGLYKAKESLMHPLRAMGGEWGSDYDRYQNLANNPGGLRNFGAIGGGGLGALAGAGLGGLMGGETGALIGGGLGALAGGGAGSLLNRDMLERYPWLAKLVAGTSSMF